MWSVFPHTEILKPIYECTYIKTDKKNRQGRYLTGQSDIESGNMYLYSNIQSA